MTTDFIFTDIFSCSRLCLIGTHQLPKPQLVTCFSVLISLSISLYDLSVSSFCTWLIHCLLWCLLTYIWSCYLVVGLIHYNTFFLINGKLHLLGKWTLFKDFCYLLFFYVPIIWTMLHFHFSNTWYVLEAYRTYLFFDFCEMFVTRFILSLTNLMNENEHICELKKQSSSWKWFEELRWGKVISETW